MLPTHDVQRQAAFWPIDGGRPVLRVNGGPRDEDVSETESAGSSLITSGNLCRAVVGNRTLAAVSCVVASSSSVERA